MTYNIDTGAWSMLFDGSDIGLRYTDINAFTILPNGHILLSISSMDYTLDDFGVVDDSDILEFTPTKLGHKVEGSFSLYFDGSDVGLTAHEEDIDALHLLDNGDLVISTQRAFSVPGLAGRDEDLIRFTPTSLGDDTSGTWSLYFDGSDVGLSESSTEDVYGIWLAGNRSFLTFRDAISVPGIVGDGADILLCTATVLGRSTNCTWDLYWDGSIHGFADERMDGFVVDEGGVISASLAHIVDLTAKPDPTDVPEEEEEDEDENSMGTLFLPVVAR